MNKRFLVLIVTGAAFATIFAAGCAANKRVKPVTSVPVVITTTTTRPSATDVTVQKVVTVFKEAPAETTVKETEATTTTTAKPTATPTAKPTNKPTATPTKKPTAKPTKKPTKKPTTKPAVKKTTETVKANTLAAAPKNDANTQDTANQLTGIYNGAWSQVTVDATNVNNVKLTVTIHDQDDPNKVSVWKMGGKLNTTNGTLIYSNCTKTNYVYEENGSVASKDVAYNNGQGKVVINNGQVTWNDYQEHEADDITFMSANGHDHRG